MFGEKHDLVHELPEYREQIHHLKSSDAHFAKLFDEYHQVEREVRRIEGGAEVSSDLYLEGRKKKRLHLKDQLHGMLQA
ncbi:MAG: YdcH family protein [Candidatus Polarisedimenticolaceae bacterium]|nr:YdcH family protein [Candidatus Polarisedimenticolaceae bacterium]